VSIVLDAMGGDHAPGEVVAGAVEAAPHLRERLILVGDVARIERLLPTPCPSNIELHPASQVIDMHEKPIDALRGKKDSSMVVGIDLVKRGLGDCFVSAGNTGAVTAGCLLSWRQIPGFHRPAIASELPGRSQSFVLLDAGASPDIDPDHLVEFAHMGRAYAKTVMGRPDPKVHLLNIGEEEGKGNQFSKEAFVRLARHPWFRGNIEGKDIFGSDCDVVVCDAFVGNIVLKTAEGVAELIVRMIKDAVPENRIAQLPYLPMKSLLRKLWRKVDYAETGGSPLLGLNGLCVICHGRSGAKAIRNALLLAQKAVERNLVEVIRSSLTEQVGVEVK